MKFYDLGFIVFLAVFGTLAIKGAHEITPDDKEIKDGMVITKLAQDNLPD